MNLLVLSAFVAGIPHRNPDLTKVTIGAPVELRPDPKNAFDATAIEVHCNGEFLGFVPRETTSCIHEVLSYPMDTRVVAKSDTRWKEVQIQSRITLP